LSRAFVKSNRQPPVHLSQLNSQSNFQYDEQYSDNESESSASENEEDTNDGTKRIKITLKNGVTIGQRKT
jgi:hypothetical protein